jgi:hypothetical protein
MCETIKLTPALRSDAFRMRLLAEVDAADLVVLAFPLYIDALPYLVTLALEAIAEHRRLHPSTNRGRLAVLVNNGFPEARQNVTALAICEAFAARSGLVWAGGLAMGAGEALCSGVPLTERAPGSRPPVGHVMRALDRAAEGLAAGHPIPAQAGSEIAKNPIPMLPWMFWRALFSRMGASHWVQEARENGVSKHGMRARPFLTTA